MVEYVRKRMIYIQTLQCWWSSLKMIRTWQLHFSEQIGSKQWQHKFPWPHLIIVHYVESRVIHSWSYETIKNNIGGAFISLVDENKEILQQRTGNTLHTPLHQASRFGRIGLVTETKIFKLHPDMVAAENCNLDTPLHEAFHQENVQIISKQSKYLDELQLLAV